MGSFYEQSLQRGRRIVQLEAQLKELRQMVDDRDEVIVALREDVAERDAHIDTMDRATYRYRS